MKTEDRPSTTTEGAPAVERRRWREPAVAGLAGAAALTLLLALAHTLAPSIPFAPSAIAQSLVRTTPGSFDSFFIRAAFMGPAYQMATLRNTSMNRSTSCSSL